MTRRRWVSEDAALDELERLNDLSIQKALHELPGLLQEAAEAEATHKAMRAKAVLLARAGGARSGVEAEATADGNDEVAAALLSRLTASAAADACKEALRSIRTNQDDLRTAIASLRSPFQGPGIQGRG